mgnify:CR=1 FL=1
MRQGEVRLLADETGEARPLTAQRQIMYPGQSASPSSHNDPQRRTTNRFQPPIPPPCERILTQCQRHSSHWHHCTVADGRPAHVESYESRGTYPTTHTTCGISTGKFQARRHLRRYTCQYIHNRRNTTGHNPNHPTSGDSRIPIHTQCRYIRNVRQTHGHHPELSGYSHLRMPRHTQSAEHDRENPKPPATRTSRMPRQTILAQ